MDYYALIDYIKTITQEGDLQQAACEQLTADAVASAFGIKRNTASQWLNQAVTEGILFKLNTRPVYFLHKKAFSDRFFVPEKSIYQSAEELKEEGKRKNMQQMPRQDAFTQAVGYNGSLKKAIGQIKTSLFYPTNRLPIILTGPTGAGKTYLGSLAYQFSVENGIVKQGAPYIYFNCAQYADNPELLSSNLFGHVRGAFTGAVSTTKGMLEAADGGFLFLDEVHRLNWESQEKLFTFMDQGTFRRVGESDGWHHVDVRLIMATTEDLSENFLPTFLRRIPVHVDIPPLEERGYEEKLLLIYSSFIEESRILNRNIQVSGKVISALLSRISKGNVGSLQNTIKYICGAANLKSQGADKIQIALTDLPEEILADIADVHKAKVKEYQSIEISPQTQLEALYHQTNAEQQDIDRIFEQLGALYSEKQRTKQDNTQFEQACQYEINAFFDRMLYQHRSEGDNALMQFITNSIQDVFRYVEYNYNIRFNGNSIYAISTYLYYRRNGYCTQGEQYHHLRDYVRQNCKDEVQIAKSILQLIEKKVDIQLKNEDEILFSLYLKQLYAKGNKKRIPALVLAHGYATASSIANVVNRLLNENIFEGFDMPIDSKVSDMVEHVRSYIEQHDISQGLVILVDMGSLRDIYTPLQQYFEGPVAIVNNVSTQLALHAGSLLQQDTPLEELMIQLQQESQTEFKVIYPQTDRQRCLITCCITGMGTAAQIKQILQQSIPEDMELKVVEHDYESLKRRKFDDPIFKLFDVIGIVGTANPRIKQVGYISLEELISGQAEQKLLKMFSQIATVQQIQRFNENLIQRFSLERLIGTLTILDANKVLGQIEECLNKYALLTQEHLSNCKRAGIYFHVSCMVERLIRQTPIENDADQEDFSKEKWKKIDLIRQAFHGIEENYSVKIPITELGYIYDILTMDEEDQG